MNPSNLTNFQTSRTRDRSALACRAKSGLFSDKYKQVDYEKLKTLAAEKKLAGLKQYEKIKQLQNNSIENRENNQMKQHKRVWQAEIARLSSNRREIERSLDVFVNNCEENSFFFSQIESESFKIDGDFLKFKSETSDRIWELRLEDVKFWLHENRNVRKDKEYKRAHRDVTETIENVRKQQQEVLLRLENNYNKLQAELASLSSNILLFIVIIKVLANVFSLLDPSNQKSYLSMAAFEGIPQAAFDLECPNLTLKAEVLKEFIIIDEKYNEKLSELHDRLNLYISQGDTGGWNTDEHMNFVHVIDQYTSDLPNRRTLYMDRLKRQFPKKSRTDLVNHESWWIAYKYYLERKKALTNDWSRDRKELLNKAKVTFAEACVVYELETMKDAYKENQRAVCEELSEKVRNWREEKMELLKLEQQHAMNKQKEIEEKMKIEEERESLKRQADKQKIIYYKEEKDILMKERKEEEARKLEELRKHLSEQAEYDRERVKFREDVFKEKQNIKEEKEKERQADIEEKEKILEILRQKVRPTVKADGERLRGETKAWKEHLQSNEEACIKQPLFELNSFTSKQITNDPRFKIEQQLRDAGLHNNDYARKLLANVKPPQEPRRDMTSNVFKHLEDNHK
ncbi:DgyrCDS6355 [Dimorphilus gyrociliatus]|uniref:DgyrCDS6355 n=1 Tax=Dimorphilus gyrociliatus TaxID=2664684 RepID=A0A7I8VN03_9ANNE|nr:DgyrCDS6355 [Dimorphilus gyrociliatus]